MTQPARDHISGAFVQYDYTNQAWLHDGVYQKCGHLLCDLHGAEELRKDDPEGYDLAIPYLRAYQCYGSKHEGEVADSEAHIEPSTGPLTPIDADDMTWSDIGPATLDNPQEGWVDSDGVYHPTPCTYDPTPLLDQPIGMFHCPLCGEMVLAGLPHP